MPRRSPCVMDGTTVGSVSTMASTWLPMAAVTAGAPPVNGTCTACTLAISRKKILRADMRTRADAGAAVGEAAPLPVVDERLQVFRRIARMHGENVGTEGHDRDGAQIVDREALVFGGGLVDRQGGGRGEDGVTVGRRAAHRFRGEVATGATAIFHHHRLAETLAQLLPHQTGD